MCGQLDEHLRQIERRLGIEIANRGSQFRLIGEARAIAAGQQVQLQCLETLTGYAAGIYMNLEGASLAMPLLTSATAVRQPSAARVPWVLMSRGSVGSPRATRRRPR